MIKHAKKVLLAVGVLAAVSFGASALGSAGAKPVAHGAGAPAKVRQADRSAAVPDKEVNDGPNDEAANDAEVNDGPDQGQAGDVETNDGPNGPTD